MNKKLYIIVISIFAIYLFVLIGFLIVNQIGKKYIIFSDDYNLVYDKEWKVIKDNKIFTGKYNIIENGKYLSNSKLDDQIKRNMSIERTTFGYRGFNLTNVDYDVSSINNDVDFNFINEVLNENNLNINIKKISLKKKYEIDLNSDGFIETIYNITNGYNERDEEMFSIIIIKGLDDYKIIDSSKFDSQMDIYINYIYFINVDDNDTVEMIIKKIYSSNIGQKILIYSFKKNSLDYDIILKEDKDETKN